MSSTKFRDPVTDDLLERIRNLKELLRSEDATVGGILSQSSGSRASGGESPPTTSLSSSQMPSRQRHLSPPTRDSPVQKKDSREGSAPTEKLIEETWHLLTQVTYVRIVIDRLNWQETPKILLDEMKKPKAPRQKSLVLLEYCFPMSTSSDGSISARDLGKRMVVPAKEILSKVVHFNHRRVVLLRMSQPILQLWSQSYFTIKIFCGKKPNSPIAKCTIPLCKLLVLPFSFDADVVLEQTNEHAKCSGKLKVCVQLGSRFQTFTERVEPMRNPTTAISEFAFIDPMKLVAHAPAPVVKPTAITPARSQPQIPSAISEESESSVRRDAELRVGSVDQRPLLDGRSQEPTGRPNVERRLNETFSEEPQETPPSNVLRRPYESRSSDYENEPAWLRALIARGGFGSGSETARSNMAEPYVSNISVYGNRPPAPSAFNNYRKVASVQTDSRMEEAKKADVAAQTSFVDEKEKLNRRRGASARIGRKTTVAERLMNRSSISFDESRETLPPASDPNRGFWLQLTIHRARNLPMVKESKNGQSLVKPVAFWTYATEASTCYTPLAAESCEPIWEWTHKIFVAPHRKTLVLKLWHRGKEGKDRVLGFVAILFPIQRPFERVWYDIIDLTRSSTGQVEISFANTIDDEDMYPKSVFQKTTTTNLEIKDKGEDMHRKMEEGPPAEELSSDENGLAETGVNTTLPMPSTSIDRRNSCASPFINLTTRAFLSQKLRTNMDELSKLTAHLKQNRSDITPASSRPISQPIDASHVTLEEARGGTTVETTPLYADPADDIFN